MIGADTVGWLDLWERAAQSPVRRRRREFLVSSGLPDALAAEHLEIGRANAQLLRLYGSMFSPRLSCQATCPRCDTALELDLDSEELLAREPPQLVSPVLLTVGEWEVAFRLPTEGDLDAAHDERDLSAARDKLLGRCVTQCRFRAEETSISLAPPEVTAHVGAQMEERDPLAALDVELRCVNCGHGWSSTLEVDVFLWARLNAWVRRFVRDVHTLARVYGWSERAIAEMSPWKRQLYLDMVEG